MDSFTIACPYCCGVHTAVADGSRRYGWRMFRVECPDTTPYAVTEYIRQREGYSHTGFECGAL